MSQAELSLDLVDDTLAWCNNKKVKEEAKKRWTVFRK